MKRLTQDILHDPDSGRRGNCFQTCLAMLTERKVEDVPHFAELYESGEWTKHFFIWLREINWDFVGMGRANEISDEKGYVIAYGPSLRGVGHSVIYKDGKLWHDPHPSRDGLKELEGFYIIEPILEYFCDKRRHLVCKPYTKENLHRMAIRLNIARSWFDKDHYDIPKKRIEEISGQCNIVSPKEIVKIVNRKGNF